MNVLYLVKGPARHPGAVPGHHIVRTKADYCRLLQTVRGQDTWEEWVLYMLEAVEVTAQQTIRTIAGHHGRSGGLQARRIRSEHKFYSQDLINNLFTHPYTKDLISCSATWVCHG